MKSRIEKLYKYIPIFIFLLYVFWIHRNVALVDGDDIVYKQAFNNISILEWCKNFYMRWGGRVPLQFLDIIFLNLPLILWKVCNSILYVLIPVYIYRFVCLFKEKITDQQSFLVNTCICVSLMLIPDSVVNYSITWITGSFNYLWPTTMLFLGIYPFIADVVGKKVKKIDMILAWIGVFLACYAEQTAAVFICMTVFCCVYTFYKKRKISITHITLFIFGVINAVIQYAAPGNMVRYDAELLKWYQNFDMYNFFDKVLLGVVHCLKNVFIPGFPLFILLLAFLGILTLKKDHSNQLCYLALCIFTILVKKIVMEMNDGVIWQIHSTKILLSIAVLIFWMLLFAWNIMNCLSESVDSTIAALFFLAVFASGIVMGMSPTVFASGERVFLISYILLILVIAFLISGVVSCSKDKEKINSMYKS